MALKCFKQALVDSVLKSISQCYCEMNKAHIVITDDFWVSGASDEISVRGYKLDFGRP